VVYPADEETFDARNTPEWIREGHLNAIQQFLKRIQDFIGYGGRLHDESGLVMPVGSIIAYTGLTAPSGWLLCDGARYLRAGADYVDLFAVIGTKYGAWDAGTFNVPDLRGVFLRGYSKVTSITFDDGDVFVGDNSIALSSQKFNRHAFPVRFTTDDTLPAPFLINTTYYIIHVGSDNVKFATTRALALAGTAIDITTTGAGTSYCHPYIEEDKDTRLKLTKDGNDGEDLGSYQDDTYQEHGHRLSTRYPTAGLHWGDPCQTAEVTTQQNIDSVVTLSKAYSFYGTPRVGLETRPRNVNVNYIIKR